MNITVFEVKKLREKTDPPIKLTDPETLSQLFDDECQQYEVLWLLVEEQAKLRDINEQQFAKIFTQCFAEATTALVAALTVFFQQCGRVELAKLTERTLNASKRLRGLVETTLSSERMDAMIDQVFEQEQKRINTLMTNTTSSGDSPES